MGEWLRRILIPVRDALRDDRRSLLLVIAIASTGFGLLAPIDRLARSDAEGPALALPAITEPDAPVGWTPTARTPDATQARAVRELLTVLLSLAWAALIIGAVTILARYIARASRRAADTGVRRAVGASRRDVALSLVLESTAIAAAGLMAGMLLAIAMDQVARNSWPGSMAPGFPWSGRAALAALLTILVGGVLALGFTRPEDLHEPEERQVNLRVPVVQLGFSLAIALTSGLLLERAAVSPPPAGSARDAAQVVIQLDSGITEPAIRAERFNVLLARLAQGVEPSIRATAPGDGLGLGMQDVVTTDCGQCSRAGIITRYIWVTSVYRFVSPDSFQAGGSSLIEGRGFTAEDRWDSPRVAVVNRHLALRHFQNGQPLGRNLFLGGGWPREPYRVVGVVDDAPAEALGGARQASETVYLSVLQVPPRTIDLELQSARPELVAGIARQTLGSQARTGPVQRRTDQLTIQARAVSWFGGWLGVVGAVVLLAGVAGTFGIVAMWVGSLAHELAVRRAVGAPRWRLMAGLLTRAAGIGLGGTAVGLFIFFVVLREMLTAQFAGLPAWQGPLFYRTAGLLVGVGLAAAWLPAWQLIRKPPASLLG